MGNQCACLPCGGETQDLDKRQQKAGIRKDTRDASAIVGHIRFSGNFEDEVTKNKKSNPKLDLFLRQLVHSFLDTCYLANNVCTLSKEDRMFVL